jgi:hypothetical protein
MRRLIYVPIIHGPADLGSAAAAAQEKGIALCGEARWRQHQETIARFWAGLADYFRGIDAANLRIYQDGLVADGEIGMRIVEDAAGKGSENYRIISSLVARGAAIRKTEDLGTVKAELDRVLSIVRATSVWRRLWAALCYRLRQGQLLRRRDDYIARAITDTLQPGEVGVLFAGAHHDVVSQLPPDIEVCPLRDRQELVAYQRVLLSRGKDARFEELAASICAPIVPPG